MFPTFKSLSDRERNRHAILRQYQQEQAWDEAKRKAYSTTLWADDVAKNAINLATPQSNTIGTQTTTSATSTPNSVPVGTETSGVFSKAVEDEPMDIGNENDSLSDIDDTDMEASVDHDKLITIYHNNPDLVNKRYNPIGVNGQVLKRWVLAKDAAVVNAKSGQESKSSVLIDWKNTLKYVRMKEVTSRIQENGEQNETSLKRGIFDKLHLNAVQSKQARENETKGPPLFSTLENVVPGSEEDAKAALSALIVNNRDLLKRIGITPFDQNSKRMPYTLELTSLKLKTQSNRNANSQFQNRVSWINTLEFLLKEIEDNHNATSLVTAGTTIEFHGRPKRSLANSQVSEGVSRPRAKKTAPSEDLLNERKIITAFKMNPFLVNDRIHPVTRHAVHGPGIDQKYIFAEDGGLVYSETRERIPEAELRKLKTNIQWGRSLYVVLQHLDAVYKRIAEGNDSSDEYLSIKRTIEDTRSKLDTMNMKSIDKKIGYGGKINLQGRGLVGAGVSRKQNRPYNLRDIQGSGRASALTYMPLGSKFIRLADLEHGKLKLVYANRSSVGPIRNISDEMVYMLKELLHNQNIDQQKYQSMSIEDQRLFHEIVKITHLQYQFRDPIKDPRELLQAEFDKLRGELHLGNTNPGLIRELKALTVDMYSQKLISDKEFKDILLAII